MNLEEIIIQEPPKRWIKKMTFNFNWLSGRKTYLVALAIGAVTIAQYLGWITSEVAQILFGLLGATGVATIRAAVAKGK